MTAIEALAERVVAGEEVTESDAALILQTPDLISVGVLADEARRRLHGSRTTFVRVFEIHVDAPVSALPVRLAAGELRLVGIPGSVEIAVAAVRAVTALAGETPVAGFSLADLQALESPGLPLRSICERLHEAGLDCVAELPIDRVRSPAAAVLDARAAGMRVLRVTIDALDPSEGVALALRARDLQRAVGGLRAFAPLPGTVAVALPSTGYDDVKQVAMARLVASNIHSIQVDWVHYGPKLAQVALTMGADDVDRVAAVDPGVLGTRRSPIEEIRGNIRAAGLEAAERNGRFDPLVL